MCLALLLLGGFVFGGVVIGAGYSAINEKLDGRLPNIGCLAALAIYTSGVAAIYLSIKVPLLLDTLTGP